LQLLTIKYLNSIYGTNKLMHSIMEKRNLQFNYKQGVPKDTEINPQLIIGRVQCLFRCNAIVQLKGKQITQ
jgi:hypothetical protein